MIQDTRTYPLTPNWIVVFADPETGMDRIEPFANDRDARIYGESLLDTGTVQNYTLYRTPNWMYPATEPVTDSRAH